MSGCAALVSSLFRMPGDPGTVTSEILDQATTAHEVLLRRAGEERTLARLSSALSGPQSVGLKRCLLCHPLLIECLHSLAPAHPELKRWHDTVAKPSAADVAEGMFRAPRTDPANIVLPLLLRDQPGWRGQLNLFSDMFGRLRFPLVDWSIALCLAGPKPQRVLAGEPVSFSIEKSQARWCLGTGGLRPFLLMSRNDCLRMLADNDEKLQARRLMFPDPEVRPRLQFASPLRPSRIRYDPIQFMDFEAHAGLTGAILQRLLDALRTSSPVVYQEFCLYMHTIRGFELSESPYGVIQSFSDPTLPGVMSINIPFTSEHEPCLSPFCFTWFAHELAHTKNYLIDNIVYQNGWSFVHNAAQRTATIPRYGRAISVRTLFQVPYVHLYEWSLLMDFMDSNFLGLPWQLEHDPVSVGYELKSEIEGAFDLIADYAGLTRLGAAVVSHLQSLFALEKARWQSVSARWKRKKGIPDRRVDDRLWEQSRQRALHESWHSV